MIEVDFKALGNRLRQKRQELGVSQFGVAAVAGLSPSFYGKIERGETKASLETFVLLLSVLNASADEMLADSLKNDLYADVDWNTYKAYARTIHDENEEMINAFYESDESGEETSFE